MVLDSWSEISENGDRGSTQSFAADVVSIVVWPGEPFLENVQISRNAHFSKMGTSRISRNRNSSGTKALQGASRHTGKGAFQDL